MKILRHPLSFIFILIINVGLCTGQGNWSMQNGNKMRTSSAGDETYLAPPFDTSYSLPNSKMLRLTYHDGFLAGGLDYGLGILYRESDQDTLWTFDMEGNGAFGTVPAQNDTLVIFGCQAGTGLYALNKETKQEYWHNGYGNLNGRSPILDEDRVYIDADSLYCLDIHTGESIWAVDCNDQITACIDDQHCYYFNYPHLLAVDKLTGDEIWRKPVQTSNKGCLGTDGEYVYHVSADSVLSRSVADGEIHWGHKLPVGPVPEYSSWGNMAFDSDFLVLSFWNNGLDQSSLYTLNKNEGSYLWHHDFEESGAWSPSIANGYVYVVSAYKPYGFILSDGSLAFHDDETQNLREQPVIADGKIMFSGHDGNIRVYQDFAPLPDALEKPDSELQELRVYPNPVVNSFSLSMHSDNQVWFELYELNGQLILNQMLEKGDWVESDFLPAGLYYYRVVSGEQVFTGHLVKK